MAYYVKIEILSAKGESYDKKARWKGEKHTSQHFNQNVYEQIKKDKYTVYSKYSQNDLNEWITFFQHIMTDETV